MYYNPTTINESKMQMCTEHYELIAVRWSQMNTSFGLFVLRTLFVRGLFSTFARFVFNLKCARDARHSFFIIHLMRVFVREHWTHISQTFITLIRVQSFKFIIFFFARNKQQNIYYQWKV